MCTDMYYTSAGLFKRIITHKSSSRQLILQSFEGNLERSLLSIHVWTDSLAGTLSLRVFCHLVLFQAASPDLSYLNRPWMKVIPSLCFTMLSVSDQRKPHWLLIKLRLFSHHHLYLFMWLTVYIIYWDCLCGDVVNPHPFAATSFKLILSPVGKSLMKHSYEGSCYCVINIHGLMVFCTKSCSTTYEFLVISHILDPTRYLILKK